MKIDGWHTDSGHSLVSVTIYNLVKTAVSAVADTQFQFW